MSETVADSSVGSPRPFDLMDQPGVGQILRWRHSRSLLQIPVFLLACLMIVDGLLGPQLAPKNLATVLTWVHYRGFVVLALLVAGNLFCMVCPFMLVRNVSHLVVRPSRMWPRPLRGKWLAAGLFVLMLFAYELFDLWSAPKWTAWLILGYFGAALLVDALFRGASFCKYLCPLGHFNFVSSLSSPLEVKVRDAAGCTSCETKDCIRGQADLDLRGCELWLFQQRKVGNMDCTFCLDCAHACPHDNVGISTRMPGSELWLDPWRSGIGRFSRRTDLAVLAVLFTFSALVNAFAMVSPVYALEEWLARLLATNSEAIVLAIIFVGALVVLPVVLLGLAGWLSRPSGAEADRPTLGSWITRYAYALVPLGFGVWLAHYAFHFLTGFWTFVPVVQSFVADVAGVALLGSPNWALGPLFPASWIYPLEVGMLGLGWLGSLLVAYQLAVRERPNHPWRAFVPWAVLLSLLLGAAIWLMGQPMEMRGTVLMG
jgi:ferredoxin